MKFGLFALLSIYIPSFCEAQNIIVNFTTIGSCGTVCFSDQSVSTSGQVVSWNWSFPGGTPATSTIQNPCVIFSPGTYSVSLTATNNNGDNDKFVKIISVGAYPVASFVSSNSCFGDSSYFQNMSTFHFKDPVVSIQWNMPGGSPATTLIVDPQTLYSTAGVHDVTLMATTQQGCTDTLLQKVSVWPGPVAAFTSNVNGNTVNFTDLSTSLGLPISFWKWELPGSDITQSFTQNPIAKYASVGSYSACLIIFSQANCRDTFCATVSILGIDEHYLSNHLTLTPTISNTGNYTISVSDPKINIQKPEVYDALGREVYQLTDLFPNQMEFRFDISGNRSGIYFVKINTDAGTITKKIILSK